MLGKEFFTEYGEASLYEIQEVVGKGISYGVVADAVDTQIASSIDYLYKNFQLASEFLPPNGYLSLFPHLLQVISAFTLVTIVFIPIRLASTFASRDVVEIIDRYNNACIQGSKSQKVQHIQSVTTNKTRVRSLTVSFKSTTF
ncbi:hypothetical protein L1987_16597 [Smallanthus sonchifolius]|uniref:Uncharacterized protein n=1 Tax=Smallanthus sonchifolius TaxID=185202 RepID=A0ACB9IWN2_9ASTR|nr:hypothetical protein L1987_16597 [Smallanthus sonchifolius]